MCTVVCLCVTGGMMGKGRRPWDGSRGTGEGKHDDRRLEIRVNTGGRMTNCQLLAPIFSF